MRLAALFLATVPFALLAQQTPPPKVVKDAPKEMKAAPLSSAAPILDRPGEERMTWTCTTEVDVAPAHPACKELAGDPRKGCTGEQVMAEIKAKVKPLPPEKRPPVSEMIKVEFDVNPYGDVKQPTLDYAGDKSLADQIMLALYALPRFAPATKGGARSAAHCVLEFAPTLLFEDTPAAK